MKDGKILALGTRAGLEAANKGAATKLVDLHGHALLPGFIDPHSHYIQSLAVANQANVYAPPSGPAADVPSLVATLVRFRDDRKIPKGELIQAYGYDDTVMPGGRLLNRDDLDQAFPDNPVDSRARIDAWRVLNSWPSSSLAISAATKTPPGGVIVRKPGSNEPYGLIMETAFLPVVSGYAEAEPGTGGRVLARRAVAVRGGRHHDGAGRRDPRRRSRGDAARRGRRRAHHRRRGVSVHHGSRRGAQAGPARDLGQVRPGTQGRWGEDHERWLAAGTHRVLYDPVPDRRARRREELARCADLSARAAQRLRAARA